MSINSEDKGAYMDIDTRTCAFCGRLAPAMCTRCATPYCPRDGQRLCDACITEVMNDAEYRPGGLIYPYESMAAAPEGLTYLKKYLDQTNMLLMLSILPLLGAPLLAIASFLGYVLVVVLSLLGFNLPLLVGIAFLVATGAFAVASYFIASERGRLSRQQVDLCQRIIILRQKYASIALDKPVVQRPGPVPQFYARQTAASVA
jgi:hypothetical protein